MLYAGNYYLAADIELDGRLFLAGDVNLCLNGKQITTTNTSVSAVVDDHWGLTLCDCRGSGRNRRARRDCERRVLQPELHHVRRHHLRRPVRRIHLR